MRLTLQTNFDGQWHHAATLELKDDAAGFQGAFFVWCRFPRGRVMARWKKPSKDQVLDNRRMLACRARSGDLRLPRAVSEIRKGIGMSQDEFANVVGLTRRQIAEIEAGAANPTIETLGKIGRLFGFEVGFVSKARD